MCIHCGEKGDKRPSRKSHPEPWKRSKAGKPCTAQRGAWGWMLCEQGHDKTSGRKLLCTFNWHFLRYQLTQGKHRGLKDG